MQDTIFTKIIKSELPCHKIYEDDKTIAFLDIHPVRKGHTLVVSKKQVDLFTDLDDDSYHALFATVKKVASLLKKSLNVDRVKVSIVGTDVPHVHVHLIPFNEVTGHKKDTAYHPTMDDLITLRERILENE